MRAFLTFLTELDKAFQPLTKADITTLGLSSFSPITKLIKDNLKPVFKPLEVKLLYLLHPQLSETDIKLILTEEKKSSMMKDPELKKLHLPLNTRFHTEQRNTLWHLSFRRCIILLTQ